MCRKFRRGGMKPRFVWVHNRRVACGPIFARNKPQKQTHNAIRRREVNYVRTNAI